MSRFVVPVLLCAVFLMGCPSPAPAGGSDSGGSDAAMSTGVEGTWRRESNYGESSRTLTLTFAADGTLTGTEMFAVVASSVATNAGCSSSIDWQGTWSVSGSNLTVTGTAGTNTTTGCTDATMNATARAATVDELARFGSTSPFTVTSTTLTFTSYSDPAPFTRQ